MTLRGRLLPLLAILGLAGMVFLPLAGGDAPLLFAMPFGPAAVLVAAAAILATIAAPRSGLAAIRLGPDDDDGVGAVELRGAEAVERADDADAEILRQAAALALEPLAVHDEAAREVRAGSVGDPADPVTAA